MHTWDMIIRCTADFHLCIRSVHEGEWRSSPKAPQPQMTCFCFLKKSVAYLRYSQDKSAWVRGGGSYPLLPQIWVSICTCTKEQTSVSIAEVCKTTYTIQDPFGISRGAGGRKGWRVLTVCTKNKKQNVTNSFLIPEIWLLRCLWQTSICTYHRLFMKVTWKCAVE